MKSSWVHRKLHLLIELCKGSGFSFPVVYTRVSFIPLHTCWSCHILVGRTREVPLHVTALWLGGQEPAPALLPCSASTATAGSPPWGAGGWARISFPLKSIESGRRSQHFLSGTLLAEAPCMDCATVRTAGLFLCSSWNLRRTMELLWAGLGLAGRAVLPWLLRILPFTCRDEDQGVFLGGVNWTLKLF